MCNCWLGILNSYNQVPENHLELNSYINKLKVMSMESINLSKTSKQFKPILAKDFIDRRKGFSILFNFCPLCGEKINWKKLRKELNVLNVL